jgi:hypothetical protein
MGAKHAQKILHFYCRPCGEYHLKTHLHYGAMKRRSAKRTTSFSVAKIQQDNKQ